jgi:hypothetical protein
MNVFNADVVDELGEEKRKGGFSHRTICERLFKSIWVSAVDVNQLVRKINYELIFKTNYYLQAHLFSLIVSCVRILGV